MTASTQTYRIFFASGEPLRKGDQDTFSTAEAADIVQDSEWAWTDRDGDLVINTYRTRCGAGQYKPVTGRQMAARLRKQG